MEDIMGNHVEKQTFSASMRVHGRFEDRMKVLEANAPRSQSDPGGRSIDAEGSRRSRDGRCT